MVNLRFIGRQITGAKRQCAVFVLGVALSMVTLVSLGSFSRSVNASLLRDAQALHAADVVIHARAPLPAGVEGRLAELRNSGALKTARCYDFYSVVRSFKGEGSLLSDLKVVEPGYPFYGEVLLASGRPFVKVLTPGNVVVEKTLLDRLGLKVGDRLRIGDATLAIGDVVLEEPDRPVNFFALGPRIFVAARDLDSLGLLGMGSRVEYLTLIKISQPRELEPIASQLRAAAGDGRLRVETYKNADSRVKKFFDNLLFFLNLSGIFTLVLAGFAIQSTLFSLLDEQERTIAVMKAVGARSRFIIGHFLAVTLLLGAVGSCLGLFASLGLQGFLPALFRGLIPARVSLAVSGAAVAEAALIGFLVIFLFTALPLYRLKEVKPRAIFGKDEAARLWDRSTVFIALLGCSFFLALVLLRLNDLKAGLYFLLALASLIALACLAAEIALRLLRGSQPKSLALRQAVKGLFRPRNASRTIIVTLSAALAVIFTITVLERNLDSSFVESFPPDAPNVFFIDIQPGQRAEFAKVLGVPAQYFPIVRGTVSAVNGEPVDPEKERRSRGDNLSREFNLTYRSGLLPDERLTEGAGLFRKDWGEPQVSVLDTVLKMHALSVGDRVTFQVQGLPVTARISSIRTRTTGGLAPYFYFVFPSAVLADAPQTIFCAARLNRAQIGGAQTRVVSRFPNVSVIDLTEAASLIGRIMGRLSVIVRFFTFFSIVAGILMVAGAVFATRYARLQESVYFAILGARRRFVLTVFAVENLLLAAVSGVIALAVSQLAGLIICRRVFSLEYRPYPAECLLMFAATLFLVVGVGLGASFSILRLRPAAFLRERADE